MADMEPLRAAGAPTRWEDDALGFLISPVTRDQFLKDYYERGPLIDLRNEPNRYADLLTLETLDHFIASADLREGMVDLTNHHDRISRDAYVDENGRVIRSAITEEYLRGATIILPHLHDSLANLGEFCRSLEEVFSCHVQTNVYLTPQPRAGGKPAKAGSDAGAVADTDAVADAGGKADAGTKADAHGNQGFPPHYDNHDVFVMQVSGAKAWRIYGTPVEIPYRGERFELGQHEVGETTQTFTLNPGDCLYLPRGVMHDAENVGEEPSLHITVGLITKTWANLLLESISELALSEPAFRRSLPAGFAARDFDRSDAAAHFEALKTLIAEKAGMDSAFDLLADNFLRARRPNVAGVIAASQRPPNPDDSYRRRRFVPWNVADDEGKLVLVGPDGDIDFRAEDGDALDVALSGKPFTVADLACEEPQHLITTLWAAGYLERIDD